MVDGVYAGFGEDEGGYEREDGYGYGGEGAHVSESHCVMSQAAHCLPKSWNLTRR